MSTQMMKKLQSQHDKTYGKFHSVMPRAIKGVIADYIKNIMGMSDDDENIENVRLYLTYELIDILWDCLGDNIPDIAEEASIQLRIGDKTPSEDELRFSDREQSYRDEGL